MKIEDLFRHKELIFKISGGLFFIDGISLLWRGGVGVLFLFHEQFTIGFLIIFLLHTIIGGLVYTYFGFCLLSERVWPRELAGWIIAFSAFVWIIPALGGDFFTAASGVVYFIGILLARFSGSHLPGHPHGN